MVYQLLRNSTIKASREIWLWVIQTLGHVFKMAESTARFCDTGNEGVERKPDEWKNEGTVKSRQKQNHWLGEGMGCRAYMGVAHSKRRVRVGTVARRLVVWADGWAMRQLSLYCFYFSLWNKKQGHHLNERVGKGVKDWEKENVA